MAWINAASEIRIQRSDRRGALLDPEEGALLTANYWNSNMREGVAEAAAGTRPGRYKIDGICEGASRSLFSHFCQWLRRLVESIRVLRLADATTIANTLKRTNWTRRQIAPAHLPQTPTIIVVVKDAMDRELCSESTLFYRRFVGRFVSTLARDSSG